MISLSAPHWTAALVRGGFSVDSGDSGAVASVDKVTVAFSGCLFNASRIDQLVERPCPSDAERVARLFLARGESSIALVDGVFSLVLHDAGDGTTIAARDRIGRYPLFYAAPGGSDFVFSPILERLVTRKDIGRAPNRRQLAQHLADIWSDPAETYYEGVRRVAPAEYLVFRGRSVRNVVYWEPVRRKDSELRGEQLLEAFEESLTRATNHALQFGRAGIFLSGGVDSISVAAVARQVVAGSTLEVPLALSLVYRDEDCNEESTQRGVAARLELPIRALPLEDALGGRTALDLQLDWSRRWGGPMWNLWLPAFITLAREGKAAGCTVILTGGGGDEWAGVAPSLGADYLRRLQLLKLYQFARYLGRSYSMPTRLLLRNTLWTFGLKMIGSDMKGRLFSLLGRDIDHNRALRAVPSWIAPDRELRDEIIARVAAVRAQERRLLADSRSFYWYDVRRSLRHPIVVQEMENKFLMGEAAGVRFFEPYWDPTVVELFYHVDPEHLSPGGTKRGVAKGLVHSLIRRHIPDFVPPKQKKLALSTFYQNRVRREAEDALRKVGDLRALDVLGVIDAAAVRRRFAEIVRDPDGRRLWIIPHVLAVEAWARQAFDGAS